MYLLTDVGKIKLPVSKKMEITIQQQFKKYLELGAFPAIALRHVLQRELLTNYFEDFIYKDIATRYSVDSAKMKDLAIYLATNSARNFSYRSIAAALNLHPNTVNDYIANLEEIFLFDELAKFDYSLKKQYTNEKKIYMVDTGLANAVSFRFSKDKGSILETIVFNALKKQYSDIYFHKDKYECDFIIKEARKITAAIQVTVAMESTTTATREKNGLIDAMKTYNLKQGLILTENERGEMEQVVDGIKYLIIIKPVWRWLLEQ